MVLAAEDDGGGTVKSGPDTTGLSSPSDEECRKKMKVEEKALTKSGVIPGLSRRNPTIKRRHDDTVRIVVTSVEYFPTRLLIFYLVRLCCFCF